MTDVAIIGASQSNYVQAVRIAAHEKGVHYEFRPSPPHADDVSAIHPLGKIPVFRHGDVTLAESRAIAGYIDDAFDGPALFPSDPLARARVEQWISIFNTAIDPVVIRRFVLAGYILPQIRGDGPDKAAIEAVIDEVPAMLDVAQMGITAQGFMGSDAFTYADANAAPMLANLKAYDETKSMLAARAKLSDYVDRIMARDSAKAALPEPVPA